METKGHGLSMRTAVIRVLQFSCVAFLLFVAADSYPVRKSPTGAGFPSGTGFGGGAPSGSDHGLSDEQEADIYDLIADGMSYEPERPFPRFAWTSDHVPLGMVEERPVFPSSHIVKSSSGYQRARDFRSDAKYSQDIFDHIPLPEAHQGFPMSKEQKMY
ncbi:uncharacterized protein LOC144987786 [Oryzias latipes]